MLDNDRLKQDLVFRDQTSSLTKNARRKSRDKQFAEWKEQAENFELLVSYASRDPNISSQINNKTLSQTNTKCCSEKESEGF